MWTFGWLGAVGSFLGLFSRGRAAIRTCRWVFHLNMSFFFLGEFLRAGWPVLRERCQCVKPPVPSHMAVHRSTCLNPRSEALT